MNQRPVLPRFFTLLLLLCLTLGSQFAVAEEGEAQKVQYIEMLPPFVLNFGGVKSKLRYLKTDISVRVNTASAAAAVEKHMPGLRNEMVLLLSRQTDEVMFDNVKREELRQQALTAAQDYLKKETNEPMVEDLLFTSFVVQR